MTDPAPHPAPAADAIGDDALWRLPASAIASLVRSRSVSAEAVTESALARMDAVNPAINAVVAAFPERARATAAAVDRAIAQGADPGPLAGVPVTVKVNIDVAGAATTNGLRVQAGLTAEADSPVVTSLTRAGAVLLGQTNTPAFSIRWFCRNALHGATLNPHDRGLTPGGSSGGAAAAVAAGIGAIAHGTDIAGSIRYPAYACGIHGLRPSLGRVPAYNASAPDRTMGAQITAVSGPLARSLDDIELGLRAMAAADARDPWSLATPLEGAPLPKRVALCLDPEGLATAPEPVAALRAAAATLEAHGWVVEEVAPPPLREPARLNLALWMAEFRQHGLPKLEEEGDADAIFVAQELMAMAEGSDAWAALQARVTLLRAWQVFLDEWPLVLLPVSARPPFRDHEDLESAEAFAAVFEAQLVQLGLPLLGLPGLTVATGRPGQPMGVQLIGPRFREDHLIAAGRLIEAAHPPIAPVTPSEGG